MAPASHIDYNMQPRAMFINVFPLYWGMWGEGSTAEATYNINSGPDALALSSIATAAASSFLTLSLSFFPCHSHFLRLPIW